MPLWLDPSSSTHQQSVDDLQRARVQGFNDVQITRARAVDRDERVRSFLTGVRRHLTETSARELPVGRSRSPRRHPALGDIGDIGDMSPLGDIGDITVPSVPPPPPPPHLGDIEDITVPSVPPPPPPPHLGDIGDITVPSVPPPSPPPHRLSARVRQALRQLEQAESDADRVVCRLASVGELRDDVVEILRAHVLDERLRFDLERAVRTLFAHHRAAALFNDRTGYFDDF
jgi:hypothetical protein